jgi:hypothetical protein
MHPALAQAEFLTSAADARGWPTEPSPSAGSWRA